MEQFFKLPFVFKLTKSERLVACFVVSGDATAAQQQQGADSWLRVWGAGCSVHVRGFRVQGSGCRIIVQALGSRVLDAVFMVEGSGFRAEGYLVLLMLAPLRLLLLRLLRLLLMSPKPSALSPQP